MSNSDTLIGTEPDETTSNNLGVVRLEITRCLEDRIAARDDRKRAILRRAIDSKKRTRKAVVVMLALLSLLAGFVLFGCATPPQPEPPEPEPIDDEAVFTAMSVSDAIFPTGIHKTTGQTTIAATSYDALGSIGSFTDGSVIFSTSGALDEDPTTFVWDKANDTLAIGHAVPATVKLSVLESGSVITPAADTLALFQASSGASTEAHVSIISGTSGISQINLGNTADEDEGRILYRDGDDDMVFIVGSNEGFSIDTTGIGINTVDQARQLELSKNASNQNPNNIPTIRFNNEDTTVVAADITSAIESFTNDATESAAISTYMRSVAVDAAGTQYATTFGVKTTGAAVAEAMRIDHDGKVVIGDTVATDLLKVAGLAAGVHVDSDDNADILIDASAANREARVRFAQAGSVKASVGKGDTDSAPSGVTYVGTELFLAGGGDGAGAANFILEADGQVAIGDNSIIELPVNELTVLSASQADMSLKRIDSTVAVLNIIGGYRMDGGEDGTEATVASVEAIASENWTASSSATQLDFRVTSSGTTSRSATKLRITEDGFTTILGGMVGTPGTQEITGASDQIQITNYYLDLDTNATSYTLTNANILPDGAYNGQTVEILMISVGFTVTFTDGNNIDTGGNRTIGAGDIIGFRWSEAALGLDVWAMNKFVDN